MDATSSAAIEQVWGEHMKREFGFRDAAAAVETMTADAVIELAPTKKRYEGRQAIFAYYRDEFIPCIESMRVEPRSRTVSADGLVDEMRIALTFDRPMPWFLPGIEPTGATIEFDLVVIVGFERGLVSFERFHWDRLGVLQQLGRA